ncbi:MAG: hypothetical protein KBD10_01270 [Candidatus Pacebacteria bacterium]|nr:hypothetical protein [Candidatus Paceibacterota bacterium]
MEEKSLKDLRTDQGLTPDEVASEVGIPIKALVNAETKGRGLQKKFLHLMPKLALIYRVNTSAVRKANSVTSGKYLPENDPLIKPEIDFRFIAPLLRLTTIQKPVHIEHLIELVSRIEEINGKVVVDLHETLEMIQNGK